MTSKRVRRLDLNKEIIDLLTKNKINTCKDILSFSELELMENVGISQVRAKEILQCAARAVIPKPTTALARLNYSKFLATGLPMLDSLLHGGIPASIITEIAGPSGCGKTQFCTLLSIVAALPKSYGGLGGGVIYIDTESAFSPARLMEMAEARFPDVFEGQQDQLDQLAQRVHVFRESTCNSLLQRLQTLQETVLETKAELIILDSVASLIRKEFDYDSNLDRNDLLAKEASLLKYLAESFAIPIVVSNQVTTRVAEVDGEQPDTFDSYLTAALGNTWAHSVNIRFVIEHIDSSGGQPQARRLSIVKSPVAPGRQLNVTITQRGIEECEDTGQSQHTPLPLTSAVAINARTAMGSAGFSRSTGQHALILQQQHAL